MQMTHKATSCLTAMYAHNLSHYNISYNFKKINKNLKGGPKLSLNKVVVGWIIATWSDVRLKCHALNMYYALLFITTKPCR